MTNILNIVLHVLLTMYWRLGVNGSAISLSTAYVLAVLLTLLYIVVSRVYEATWRGWSWRCLLGWGDFARLAIPGLLLQCLEGWQFQVSVILGM